MTKNTINGKIIPEGATHHHSMGSITIFYKREDLYKENDGRKWMGWVEKNNRWETALVNTVHTQADGTPNGFEAIEFPQPVTPMSYTHHDFNIALCKLIGCKPDEIKEAKPPVSGMEYRWLTFEVRKKHFLVGYDHSTFTVDYVDSEGNVLAKLFAGDYETFEELFETQVLSVRHAA